MKGQANGRLHAYLSQLKARRAAGGTQDGGAPSEPTAAPAATAAAVVTAADQQPAGLEIEQQLDNAPQLDHVGMASMQQPGVLAAQQQAVHEADLSAERQPLPLQQDGYQQQQQQGFEQPIEQHVEQLPAEQYAPQQQQQQQQQEQQQQQPYEQPPALHAQQHIFQQQTQPQHEQSPQPHLLLEQHAQQQQQQQQQPLDVQPAQQQQLPPPLLFAQPAHHQQQQQPQQHALPAQLTQQGAGQHAAAAAAALADIIDLTADEDGGGDGSAGTSTADRSAAAASAAAAGGGLMQQQPAPAQVAAWRNMLSSALQRARGVASLAISLVKGQQCPPHEAQAAGAFSQNDAAVLHAAARNGHDPGWQQQAQRALQQVQQARLVAQHWHKQQAAFAAYQQQQQQQGRALTTGGAPAPGGAFLAGPQNPLMAAHPVHVNHPQQGHMLTGFGGVGGSTGGAPGMPGGGLQSHLHAQPYRPDKEAAVKAAMEALETAGDGNEESEPPEGLLLTPLLRHQRVALAWMVRREAKGEGPIGGLLADDQGLGKTVSTIALILSNRPPAKQQGQMAVDGGTATLAKRAQRQAGKRKRLAALNGGGEESEDVGSGGSSSDEYPTSNSDSGTETEEEGEGEGRSAARVAAAAAAAGAAAAARGGTPGPASSEEVVCVDGASPAAASEESGAGRLHAGTLVVCPTTVLHQWAAEIRSKVNPHAGISVHVYHGKGKAVGIQTLSHYAVVLTTYQTMALEAPKREGAAAGKNKKQQQQSAAAAAVAALTGGGSSAAAAAAGAGEGGDYVDLLSDSEEGEQPAGGQAPPTKRQKAAAGAKAAGGGKDSRGGPLFQVMWHRVVLDEAQCIKNPRTLTAHAAWSLKARARWCLSGTPLQNTLDDLYSYFRFLKYDPYSKRESFNELLRDPITAGGAAAERGYQRLRYVLKGVMLRRTKQSKIDGQPIIDLPPRLQTLHRARMSPAEREFYERLKTEASAEFRRLQEQSGGVGQHYIGVLWQLLRLRQACNHPLLVKGVAGVAAPQDVPAAELAAARKLVPHLRAHLAELLQPLRLTPCLLCGDIPEDAVVGVCGHVFCAQCVATEISNAGQSAAEAEMAFHCPQCKHALGRHDTFSAAGLAAAAGAAVQGGRVGNQQQQHHQGALPPALDPGQQQQQQQVPGGSTAAEAAGVGAGAAAAAAAAGGATGSMGGGVVRWQSSAKLDALMELLKKLRDKGAAAEAAVKKERSVLTSGRSLSNSRMAAALGGGGPRQPSRGAGAGGKAGTPGAGGSRGASPRPPMEKVIVFSQWTGMLDLAEAPLRREHYPFRRLDGTMNIKARQQAIEDFSHRPEVSVLLVSLKAASLGVNLVSANHVVLLDLWYNPTVEEQAIDRAHRIGQIRPVHVTRITIEDSIEDKILELQERKRATIAQAFDEGGGANGLVAYSAKLSQEDMRQLFEDVVAR